MTTITYSEALAGLDASIERAADQAHDIIVRYGLDEDEAAIAMQCFYLTLDEVRAECIAEIDAIFSRGETLH